VSDEPRPAAVLGDDSDPIGPGALDPLLGTSWLGRRHVHLETCQSTNDRAAAEGRAGEPEGLIVTTDAQTAGRGRLGRTWHSPPGENLAFSILLRPARPPAEIPPLTLLAGAAVASALRSSWSLDARLKWPNDVLLHGASGARPDHPRKVAGILTEAASLGDRLGHLVVGIGLNVNTDHFPEELADKATSLRLARGARLARAEVLASVLRSFERLYDGFRALGPAAAVAAWNEHADRDLRVRGRIGARDVEGVTDGVMPDGSLRLRSDDGTVHRIVSGEIITAV
jgi:BirA family transcriptional regulator, biotin operon repressor / biotin---[acetyl-CoA-carboxylase] ligase